MGLKGRTIIATEGVNMTLEGEKDPRFQNIHWKKSVGTGSAFPRLSVKVRNEIVSLHLGTCDVDPNETTGIHLKPEELHEWIKSGKEFYIVDMRNAYEHKVGHFEGSICPSFENFRDLPKIMKEIEHLKEKTVLTVCTGGVRCEKASGYLITQGFKDVYQLDGGIVSYMEKYPNEDFKGKLYVFDARIVVMPARPDSLGGGFYTDDPIHEIVGECDFCKKKCDRYLNCEDDFCHNHLLVCEECENKKKGKLLCPFGCKTRSGKRNYSFS